MLDLTKIKQDLSPNFGPRGGKTPEIIVLHCPVGTLAGTVATFKNPAKKVSAHYVVDRDGSILQMVALENAAWHAMHYPNLIGIGIEMVDMYLYSGYMSRGCMGDPQWFTKPELDATADLVAALMQKFNISLNKVMGHNDPWLKQFGNNHVDPGPHFPWVNFRQLVNLRIDVANTVITPKLPNSLQLQAAEVESNGIAAGQIKPRKKRGKPLKRKK